MRSPSFTRGLAILTARFAGSSKLSASTPLGSRLCAWIRISRSCVPIRVSPICFAKPKKQSRNANTTMTNALDAWVREVVQWHFNPETGCPFWLDYAKNLSWNPRKEIQTYADLSKFGFFQDEWLSGGPVRRWV